MSKTTPLVFAMSQTASKQRICSYDMLEVRPDGYTLTETEGEMYFCNARCLCIWAVQLATRPNLADGRKLPGVQLTQPTGEQRTFAERRSGESRFDPIGERLLMVGDARTLTSARRASDGYSLEVNPGDVVERRLDINRAVAPGMSSVNLEVRR